MYRRVQAIIAILVPVGLAAGTTHSAPAGPPGVLEEWVSVFREDFTGSELDFSRWTTCYWWDNGGCSNLGNNELQWYLPANVGIRSGVLELTARAEKVRGFEGRQFPYTSGMVTTGRHYNERSEQDRFALTYGYFEIRAKVPAGQGLWPAFWLLPSTHDSKPEIDILEVLGHRPNVLEMHVHFRDDSGKSRSVGHESETVDLSRDWHTYGLLWSSEAVIWYLDGVEHWRYEDTLHIPSEPMYLILNLAVGGDWPGKPNQETKFPAKFLIDYVEVYQQRSQ